MGREDEVLHQNELRQSPRCSLCISSVCCWGLGGQEAKAVLCEHKLNNNHSTDRESLLCNFWHNYRHMHWKKKEVNQHLGSLTCRCQTLSVEPGGSVFPGRPARQGGQVPPLPPSQPPSVYLVKLFALHLVLLG